MYGLYELTQEMTCVDQLCLQLWQQQNVQASNSHAGTATVRVMHTVGRISIARGQSTPRFVSAREWINILEWRDLFQDADRWIADQLPLQVRLSVCFVQK
jgi:hypothetical protein